MIVTDHSQTLTEFRENVAETLERLNQTGEAEVITVDGKPRAILISPAVYEELAGEVLSARDIASMRRSMQEFKAGKGQEVNAFLPSSARSF